MSLATEKSIQPVGQQAAGPQPVERRREKRRRIYGTHWLTIRCVTGKVSSFVVARLVDISPGGFGVCTLEPVEVGHEYAVAGEVQVDDQWLEVSGYTRVVYCTPSKEGPYRVGLVASGIRCQSVPKPG